MARPRVISRVQKMTVLSIVYVDYEGSVEPRYLTVNYPSTMTEKSKIWRYIQQVYDLPAESKLISDKLMYQMTAVYEMPEYQYHKLAKLVETKK